MKQRIQDKTKKDSKTHTKNLREEEKSETSEQVLRFDGIGGRSAEQRDSKTLFLGKHVNFFLFFLSFKIVALLSHLLLRTHHDVGVTVTDVSSAGSCVGFGIRILNNIFPVA
ncbi:hypothetical protein JTE90_003463 [Oedothorax gibbosus]|uniref:Uncharacterized protein n=1 Tax=Oedothorax gibbosus TaxID=931172 RepID=A0AAV6U4U1_9ARAC|nr:hypothetical protein JTE90_003463 [Oedothorax gibbosus]